MVGQTFFCKGDVSMTNLPLMTVSGIRGIVGETLTPQLCYTIAFLQTKRAGVGTIIVSRDTRPSGIQLAGAIESGIRDAGGTPLDIGIAPTPTACVAVGHFGARGGIMITASHNPLPFNGYKMIHESGRLFTGSECDVVYGDFAKSGVMTPSHDFGTVAPAPVAAADAVGPHLDRIMTAVDATRIRKAGIRIAVDSINGAAGVIFPLLLERLGVTWVGVHNRLNGDFVHNPEPRPEHLSDLSKLLASTPGLRGGFAFDPDADRLALMGEHGEPVTEELTLVLALENILSKNKTSIATNLSTSMMVDDVAAAFGVPVIRTKIGEANVVEGMQKNGCGSGGEGNGGVIYPAVSTVRDGLLGMALVCELMATTGRTVTQCAARWPSYAIVKDKIPVTGDPRKIIARLTKDFSHEKTDIQDGLKIITSNGWVHIRPSNTEPIIRCYAEALTQQRARELADMVMDKI
jgi:phosphomannomutase